MKGLVVNCKSDNESSKSIKTNALGKLGIMVLILIVFNLGFYLVEKVIFINVLFSYGFSLKLFLYLGTGVLFLFFMFLVTSFFYLVLKSFNFNLYKNK